MGDQALSVELDTKKLQINVLGPAGQVYTIALRTCDTSAQVLYKLCRVHRLPWCTPEALGAVLEAIDRAFRGTFGRGLEEILCPRGSSNLVSWGEGRRQRRDRVIGIRSTWND